MKPFSNIYNISSLEEVLLMEDQIAELQRLIDYCAELCSKPIKLNVYTVPQWIFPEDAPPALILEVQKRLILMEDETKTSQEVVLDTIHMFIAMISLQHQMLVEQVDNANLDKEYIMADPNNANVGTAAPNSATNGNEKPEAGASPAQGESVVSKDIKPWHVVVSGIGGLLVGATGMFFAAPVIRGFGNKEQAAGEAAFGGFGGLSL
jgi:hypothetical protein